MDPKYLWFRCSHCRSYQQRLPSARRCDYQECGGKLEFSSPPPGSDEYNRWMEARARTAAFARE